MSKIVEVDKITKDNVTVLTTVIYETGYARYYFNRTDKIPKKVLDFVRSCAWASYPDDETTIYHG